MHISNTVLLIATTMAPSALGAFMTLAFNTKSDCSGSMSSYDHYNANQCRTLGKNDWAVDIWFTGSPCKLYAYENTDCTGSSAVLPAAPGDTCHSLAGRWSVMVTDCSS
ncbi:hypothetical protein F5Y17DRAFT_421110 [Xylariaceae sp. FL0594]|nr:hypothetical protein F5Y17DRAFT_421110 [Xylariaceae sp. FL0594]